MPSTTVLPGDILATKLEIPSLGGSIVRRDRLVRLFRKGSDRQVTAVIAPAGYGKTTLLVEWLLAGSSAQNHTAWVSLDPLDNSPRQFWSYVAFSLRKIYPRLRFNPQKLFPFESDLVDIDQIIPLINKISRIPFRFNLVLDNYQSINEERIHSSLSFLIEHQPKNMHIILSSRVTPPVPLCRLRVQGRLIEITAKDLSFTPQEVNTLVYGVLGLNISPEQVSTLHQVAEGWIAGLQMAALSTQSQSDSKYLSPDLPEGNRQIFSYLIEEVLNRQDPAVQEFLLQTSLLPEFSAPLCDAMLSRSDSKEYIARIDLANLFMVSLDNHNLWYRFHPLFAAALAFHLHETHPEIIPGFHRTACTWLLENGYPEKAVSHALAVGDTETAFEIVDACALEILDRNDFTCLIHWTSQLPLDLIARHPVLGIYTALAYFHLFQIDQVKLALLRAEQALDLALLDYSGNKDEDNFRWEIAAIRTVMGCLQGDISDGIPRILALKQTQPEVDPYFSCWLEFTLAEAYEASDDFKSAAERYDQSRLFAVSHEMPVTYLNSTMAIAHLRKIEGRLNEAELECRRALDFACKERLDENFTAIAHLFLAEINLERMTVEPDAIRVQYEISRFDKPTNSRITPVYRNMLYLHLAKYFLAYQDPEQSTFYLNKAVEDLRNNQSSLISELIDVQVRLWAVTGALAAKSDSFTEDFPFSRFSHLPAAAVQTALARIYLARGDLSKSLHLLNDIEKHVRQTGMGERLIEILFLKALAYLAENQVEDAFELLRQALELAEPEGYLRSFIVEGEFAKVLFKKYLAHQQTNPKNLDQVAHLAYVQRIIHAFDQPPATRSPASPPSGFQADIINPNRESLSCREQEVFNLLDAGKSTKEVAAVLMISINTAKTHVRNIHRKLDAFAGVGLGNNLK